MSTQKLPKAKRPNNALSAAQVRTVTAPGYYGDGNCLYLVIDDHGLP